MKVTYELAALMGFLLAGMGTGTCDLQAQVPYDQAYGEEAMDLSEQVILFTDRNMYAVSESIWFRSFYRINEMPVEEALSRVLYVELVTPSGESVARAKYPHHSNGSAGYLDIPSDAISGNYFLRSYTRWMRNFGPRSYSYVPLTIINPYRRDILKGGNGPREGYRGSFRPGNAVQCRADKSIYLPGETVRIELSLPEGPGFYAGEYCLTVVPAGLADTVCDQICSGEEGFHPPFSFDYLPEIRGVSVSGSVVMAGNQLPLQTTPQTTPQTPSPSPNTRVHFSMLGEEPEYFGALTDEMGRFMVTLPDRTGTRELFVAAESSVLGPSAGGPSVQAGHSIRIDQDFTTDPLPFSIAPFELSAAQRESATRMVMNMQLSVAFQSEPAESRKEEKKAKVPFYGIPVLTIHMEEYVSLPTMTEVFENLIPLVYVKYRKGEPSLKIESQNTMISHYPPLILLDRIPVFDHQAVLSVDPSKILKIEVINEVYVRGSLLYGGVIVLTSKAGDMASIDLPEGSYFFDYRVYHQPGRYEPEPGTGRTPDSRNTLVWMDSIRLDQQEKEILQFPASSRQGEYLILVRGVSPRNEIVFGTDRFEVARGR